MSITSLPTEILLHLFAYFPSTDLLRDVKRVCKRWKTIILSTSLWIKREFNCIEYSNLIIRLSEVNCCIQRLVATHDQLKTLFRQNPTINLINLISLRLHRCECTIEFLKEVLDRCPKLNRLELVCSVLSYGIHEVFAKDYLVSFEVYSSTVVDESHFESSNDFLISLASSQRQIDTIAMSYNGYIADTTIAYVIANCTNITVFRLYSNCALGQAFKNSTEPLKFKEFTIRSNSFDDNDLKFISKRCRNLEVLQIEMCPLITDKGICDIAHNCTKLQKIHVIFETSIHVRKYDAGITCNCLLALSKGCPNLKEIFLNHCEQITDDGIVLIAQHCRKLQHVNLKGCSAITDITLISLAQHSKLLYKANFTKTSISLNGLLPLLNACKGLKSLTLSSLKRDNSRFKTDVFLGMSSSRVPVLCTNLIAAQQCKDSYLNEPYHSHLSDLDLSNTNFTKKDVLTLVRVCPDLVYLNLNYSDEIDTEIEFIEKVFKYCTCLNTFSVGSNRVVRRLEFYENKVL